MFDGRLHFEDQVHLWAAKVNIAPVEALVDARVVGNRGLWVGQGDDLDVVKLNLEATKFDALVVH